ncbi:hypothetical protein ACFO5O_12745 [Geojedonia litorea]|uniref:Lipoprotein n=1 Tax=Geojedonia litorea TaxID=1268269 RepID=A0ABV9N4D5_9FLAO
MKLFKLLFVLGGVTHMLTACDAPQDLNFSDVITQADLKVTTNSNELTAVPFKAKLFTRQAEDALTEVCSFNSPTDFWGLEHQIGEGTGTHLGKFTVDFKFCFHIVLDEQGFPDFEGGFGEFDRAGGSPPVIEAANGDRLFAEVREESSLIPIQDDTYRFKFENLWHITGGTGKFENASGEFIGYGMVRREGTGTDHTWEGRIILK